MNETSYELAPARKTFSRIGLAMSAILVITTVLQLLCVKVPVWIWGQENWLATSSWGKWIVSFLPIYAVAIPIGVWIMSSLPARKPQDNKLGAKGFLTVLPICFCLMYGGNLIGTLLSLILSGGTAENAVLEFAMDNHPLKVLVMVILAPLLEEYVCRKQIIDRTRQYGEKTAVILSGLVFGLLHQNLYQFFYAFGLGVVFAYIYIRTGRLRYTALLHGIINFMGSVIAPWLLTQLDMETLANLDPTAAPEVLMTQMGAILPGLILYMGYAMFLIGMAIAGLVLLILKFKKLRWERAEAQLPGGTAAKTVYWNVGMVLYIVLCLVFIVLALI